MGMRFMSLKVPPTTDGRRRGTRTIGWHRWLPEEYRVVDRYAKALTQGRIAGMGIADARCREELVRMAVAAGRDPRRLPVTVRKLIYARARLRGWNWAQSVWQADETMVLEKYARQCVRGRYPTIKAAARACWKEMRATCSRVGRPLNSVRLRLWEAAHERGRQPFRRWTAEESRIMARHIRWLFEGRYHYIRQAAEACARELRRAHDRRRGGAISPPPRPASAVYQRMTNAVPGLRLPRYKGRMTSVERTLIERYARALGRGEYPDARVAAAACRAELQERYRSAPQVGPVRLRAVTVPAAHTLGLGLLAAMRRLGLFVLNHRRWTEEEQHVCDAWVRWYESRRHARRHRRWRDAVEGLLEELEQKGYRRTSEAASYRLKYTRRRLSGMER